jgi:hypothetical protein
MGPQMGKSLTFTTYLKYRARTRKYDLQTIEEIVRRSNETYYDTATLRTVVVGKHGNRLVLIPYDSDERSITPVAIHAVPRAQLELRVKTGRFIHE